MPKIKRESNIELLRIICILAVVMHHCTIHTSWSEVSDFAQMTIRVLGGGARIAINIFLLITGYFCIKSSTDIKKKVMKLWKERVLYAVLISIFMLIIGVYTINVPYILRAIFPIITCRHNYITTFIMLYLFIPFINKFLLSMTESEMQKFIILATVILSIIPTVLSLTDLYSNNAYSYLAWMIYVYCIGAYIRLYGKRLPYGWLSLGILIIILLMEMVVEPNCKKIPIGYTSNTQYNIIVLLAAVFLFGFFINLKIAYNKFINALAGSTFAVLLIHDDPLVRSFLWNNVLKCATWGNSKYFLLYLITTVIIVYIACVTIDKLITYIINILKSWLRSEDEKN